MSFIPEVCPGQLGQVRVQVDNSDQDGLDPYIYTVCKQKRGRVSSERESESEFQLEGRQGGREGGEEGQCVDICIRWME